LFPPLLAFGASAYGVRHGVAMGYR